jgi:hypothetical protein
MINGYDHGFLRACRTGNTITTNMPRCKCCGRELTTSLDLCLKCEDDIYGSEQRETTTKGKP